MKRYNFSRKTLSLILCIALVSIFTLTIAYAALSVTLNIVGNAEIVASNWNIHLANPRVSSGSVTNTLPVISGNTMTFSSNLVEPGDYYEFSVDVVNDGTIDAMIDSVVVTPTLTDAQKKYLRYEVTYQNGESISVKQTLKKNTSMPIKVRVEFRDDIPVSDLPSTATALNHKVTLVYSQSDGTGSSVVDDGVYYPFKVGNELCIEEECFYVLYSDDSTVTLLAKYNLLVGNKGDDVNGIVPLENPTGIQDESANGWFSEYTDENPLVGLTFFSSNSYWSSTVNSYPAYVYGQQSTVFEYVENYKTYLENSGASILDARLISVEELEELGCSIANTTCKNAPSFVYSVSYWTGSAKSKDNIWRINNSGSFNVLNITTGSRGVRPVIVVPKWYFTDIIEFTVDGSVYTGKEGMTWGEWSESIYDVYDDFGIHGNYIGHFRTDDEFLFMEHIYNNNDCNDEGDICGLGIFALKDDVIIPGHKYYGG